ncbi:hypothetical protein MML48_8g00002618 [Holotrichia oblita]|uniref:Uncharacterized protein n=1 Tax=Holotrichia oblita TaxID=644536 RepID=A0ACB9SQF4_HOLOL|nr:hypothetical protein MML48_8g00002618 [Holotrichia oblita]
MILQGAEEHSNSTTESAPSPTPMSAGDEDRALWRALTHNGHSPSTPLSGEASQLLRKLITCKKLGMSITPAPANHSIGRPTGISFRNAELIYFIVIAPKKENNTSEQDSEDLLSALRRQLQPHLVMALQGHKNLNYPNVQAVNYNPIITTGSPAGSAAEAESEEENYNDLPLNLVATQMAETETH